MSTVFTSVILKKIWPDQKLSEFDFVQVPICSHQTHYIHFGFAKCVQDPAKPDLRAVAEALAAHAGGEHSDAAAQGLLQALGVQDMQDARNTDQHRLSDYKENT